MTFTEVFTSSTRICDASKTIGQGLEECLLRALNSGRVTVGVKECAKLLSCASDQVMLCLMPDMASASDVSVHIQQTLIRSFCWENGIRLLTVKNCPKLRELLSGGSAPCWVEGEAITCLLIEKPKGDLSAEDAYVCHYHDAVFSSDIYPKPIIQLPV
ncbi:growth arrest and DNA damage-inducible protein GADD45 beta-like [Pomacea canaliculata]|uniref:growth arrest and DNA damage-inducible protein GADD45 beta-like n=1 Tax=Pomacea canaliculata TaxID=400727 RepID=UPI000D7339CC|nr:growth arrest and DNA damage-inducible protein GADD45 beta-like [Pomacea canaliculata]